MTPRSVYTDEVRRHRGLELRLRVGLNSGEVVVRAIGNDLHMDYSAVGEATHLAARMEQMAMPGAIRLTAATLRLVEGLVRVNALTEPVEVFELLGATSVRQRLQATAIRGLSLLWDERWRSSPWGRRCCRLGPDMARWRRWWARPG